MNREDSVKSTVARETGLSQNAFFRRTKKVKGAQKEGRPVLRPEVTAFLLTFPIQSSQSFETAVTLKLTNLVEHNCVIIIFK
jgi:hypothetical protein